MEQIRAMGVRFAELVLHVGLGTFQPIEVEDPSSAQDASRVVRAAAKACAETIARDSCGGRSIDRGRDDERTRVGNLPRAERRAGGLGHDGPAYLSAV